MAIASIYIISLSKIKIKTLSEAGFAVYTEIDSTRITDVWRI